MENLKKAIVEKFRKNVDYNKKSDSTFSIKCLEENKNQLKNFMKENEVDGSLMAELMLALLKETSGITGGDDYLHDLSITRLALIQNVSVFVEEIVIILNSFEIEWKSVRDLLNNTKKATNDKKAHYEKDISDKELIIEELNSKLEELKKQLLFLIGDKEKTEKLLVLQDQLRDEKLLQIEEYKSEIATAKEEMKNFNEINKKNQNIQLEQKKLIETLKEKDEKQKMTISALQNDFEKTCLKLDIEHEKKVNSLLKDQRDAFESKINALDEKYQTQIEMLHQYYKERQKLDKESLKSIYDERISDLKGNLKN